jgi:selenide,water dikinase
MVTFAPQVDPVMQDILFDPQTSGGLLMTIGKDVASNLLTELKEGGVDDCAIIGEVVSEPAGKILVN